MAFSNKVQLGNSGEAQQLGNSGEAHLNDVVLKTLAFVLFFYRDLDINNVVQTVPLRIFTSLGGEQRRQWVPLTSKFMIFIDEFSPKYQRPTRGTAVRCHFPASLQTSLFYPTRGSCVHH